MRCSRCRRSSPGFGAGPPSAGSSARECASWARRRLFGRRPMDSRRGRSTRVLVRGSVGCTRCMCSPLRRTGSHVWSRFKTSLRCGVSICRPAARERRTLSATNERGTTMSAIPVAQRDPSRGLKAFRVFLRVYGVLTLAIFVALFVGFLAQSPLLAEHGGALNWTIWNDVRCGSEHLHVPPMLMVIYIVWGVFLLR